MAPKASNYKTIKGVKYDKGLIEKAEKDAADGQISVKEAQGLWKDALDDGKVTTIERRTLEYVLKEYKFTDKAAEFLKSKLFDAHSKGSYYKQIDGVKYDRGLLEQAEKFSKLGEISAAQAVELWEGALDGVGVTPTERRSLEYCLKTFKFREVAK
jgi:OOP family OmpA-OmpF porin